VDSGDCDAFIAVSCRTTDARYHSTNSIRTCKISCDDGNNRAACPQGLVRFCCADRLIRN
jgi:hypothetical protein